MYLHGFNNRPVTPRYRDSIKLVAALRQAPPCLGRYHWRLFGEGIVEGRSTEIEHSLL